MATDYLILRAAPSLSVFLSPLRPRSENSYTAGGGHGSSGRQSLSYGLFVSCQVKRKTEGGCNYQVRPRRPSTSVGFSAINEENRASPPRATTSSVKAPGATKTQIIDSGRARAIAALVSWSVQPPETTKIRENLTLAERPVVRPA